MKKSSQSSLFTDPVKIDEDPFVPITRDTKDRKLLSLDIATHTGWCTRTASGVWNFTPKKDESPGFRLIRFRGKLTEICKIEDIQVIVFEAPAVYGKFPNFVGIEMMGVLKVFCTENNIDHKAYVASTIQKYATGKGKGNKQLMIKMAKEKYGIDCETDDEADALHLYYMAIEDLNL